MTAMQRQSDFIYAATVIIAAMILFVPSIGKSEEIKASPSVPVEKIPDEFTINVPYKTQPGDIWPYKAILLKKSDAAYKALKELLVKENTGWKEVPPKNNIDRYSSIIKDTYFYSSTMDVVCNSKAYNHKKGELIVEYIIPRTGSTEKIDPKIPKSVLWNSESVQIVTLVKYVDACPDFFSLIHTED
jgi:hypothetical protein